MDLKETVMKQREFFSTHKTKKISFRIDALKRLRKTIYKYEDKINSALTRDLHKSKEQAYVTEIGLCLRETNIFIKNLKKWSKLRKKSSSVLFPLAKSYVKPEPFGVSLIISPWNYPVFLSLMPLIAAIGAGNCVILKPASSSAACSDVLDEMISDCFPEEHVKVVKRAKGENYNILDEKFDRILFTGSPETGKKVLAAAARHITPVTLELGGKSPCIVHKDADIQLAAARASMGKFINAGQNCVSPDYALVHRDVKNKFTENLKLRVKKMYTNNPEQSDDYGRVINDKEFDRISSYLKEASIIYGGKTNRETKYIEPTIIDEPPGEAGIMKEEIFGPLFPVITYEKISDAIDFVNKREKPLVAYVFTRDKGVKQRVLNETSSGGACVNDTVVQLASPDMPFGGAGMSGYGRYRGKYGFDSFSNLKSVMEQTTLFDIPFRYPPLSKFAYRLFKKLLK